MLTWTEARLQPLDRGGNPGLRLNAVYNGSTYATVIWFPGRLWRVTHHCTRLGDFQTRTDAVTAVEMHAGRWRTK